MTSDEIRNHVISRLETFAPCFREWTAETDDEYITPTIPLADIFARLGSIKDLPAERIDIQVDKAVLTYFSSALDEDSGFNRRFVDLIPHPIVAKLVGAARIKELARARIVKKGGGAGLRYDISDLAATFYGKKILESLGMSRRRVVQSDELPSLQAVCQKFKLSLPEAVEPTTTERYFSEEYKTP